MARVSWLHLTDLHQGLSEQNLYIPNVREEFYKDLERLHEKTGPLQLVIFSGDLTQKGSPEDFQQLDKTLIDLWEHLNSLGSQPKLLVVPGNHDLVRPEKITSAVRCLVKQWPDISNEFWSNQENEYFSIIKTAFASYQNWLCSTTIPLHETQPGLLPGDFSAIVEFNGVKLGVIGLNSTFLQLTDDKFFGDNLSDKYKGQLHLDIRQIQSVCDGDSPRWLKRHHANLLVTHHPVEWLSPASQGAFRSEIAIPGNFTAHLFGHMHTPDSRTQSIGGAAIERNIQGASLFGIEKMGDGSKQRIHGYNIGAITINDNGDGELRFWPRIAEKNLAGYYHIVPDYKFSLKDEAVIYPFNPLLKKK